MSILESKKVAEDARAEEGSGWRSCSGELRVTRERAFILINPRDCEVQDSSWTGKCDVPSVHSRYESNCSRPKVHLPSYISINKDHGARCDTITSNKNIDEYQS